jgi:hypothetical protein
VKLDKTISGDVPRVIGTTRNIKEKEDWYDELQEHCKSSKRKMTAMVM